ncbi:Fc receptor-like protein 5 isoform 2-T2 [Menidia menidia]
MISECSLLQPRLTGPEKAFLNSRVAFRCVAPGAPPPVTYRLLRDGGAPVATHVDDEGGQTAVFPLKVTTAMGGAYRCRAAAGGITGVSAGVRLTVVTPASNTRVESDPSPPVAFEGSRVALSCEVDRGSHLSYTWFFNRTEVGGSWPGLRASGSRLVLERATPQQAGGYYCVAWATVQDTRRFSTSTEIQVVVKVFLSKPMISFSMVKVGDGYRGNVTCWCSRGSPPANFSLWVDGRPVGWFTATGALAVSFPVPAAPGLDMGEARCRVQSPRQQLHSEPLSLESPTPPPWTPSPSCSAASSCSRWWSAPSAFTRCSTANQLRPTFLLPIAYWSLHLPALRLPLSASLSPILIRIRPWRSQCESAASCKSFHNIYLKKHKEFK